MSFSEGTRDIFSAFQKYLSEEQDIREEIRVAVRELEQKAREILAVLQAIHQPDGIKNLAEICARTDVLFSEVKQLFDVLKSKIPQGQYYRFHDHWRFCIQRLCFLVALVRYLQTDGLITHAQTAEYLGLCLKREEGFHLDLDDYLMGLLFMVNELSRLAVNAVTSGDYGRPIKIASFLGELDSGFRLLNLKNDSLRKKFDGLKYDLKKVEEVVYDVTIRGLRPTEGAQSTSETTAVDT